jgi:hypothetical protein
MKKIIAFAITTFAIINPLQSQAQNLLFVSAEHSVSSVLSLEVENRLETALDTYMKGLNNTMPTSIEASMFNLLVLRLEYPYSDFSSTVEKLTKLSVEGKTSVIRYKAHITLQYINDPVLFLEIETVNFIENMDSEKADLFYLALSENLQNHIKSDSKD